MSLTATRPPFFDPAPLLVPVPDLQHAVWLQVSLQDQVAPTVEVGVGTQLHGLVLDEDVRLEELQPADPDLLDPTDADAIQRDIPLGGPAGVELDLGGVESGVHAGTVSRTPAKADPARISALFQQGLGTRVIAERTGISQRQVVRWLNRLFGDSWKRHPRISDEQRARILQLARDQVPAGWIAEECNVSKDSVASFRADAEIPADPDWKLVRLQIQHDPTLFALHLEFGPVRLRRS